MVVKQVKQWLVVRANSVRWRAISDWAQSRDALFKLAREGEGFLIEPPRGQAAGIRIEWGASQRSYIEGFELRMRCAFELHPELQLMVLGNALMEKLEAEVFQAYTDTLKTRIDTDTPEEMRWLVMFPKYTQASSRWVRQHLGVLGVNKQVAGAWIEGELSLALEEVMQNALPPDQPFVLMAMRGNIYLRTQMAEPALVTIQALVKLVEAAATAARLVDQRVADSGAWKATGNVSGAVTGDVTGNAPWPTSTGDGDETTR